MKTHLSLRGNHFARKTFELADACDRAEITISADPQRYLREFCLPLRGDGNDGNWLMGGSFVKFRLFFDGELLGIGPFRAIRDGFRVEHSFSARGLAPGRHVLAVAFRGERDGIAVEFSAPGLRFGIDPSWKVYDANRVYMPICWKHPNIAGHFKGDVGPGEYFEHLNGHAYPDGWTTTAFDDSGWADAAACRELELPTEKADWNYVVSDVRPRSIVRTPDGRRLVDFGAEMIGSFSLVGPAGGGEVEVRLGEEMLTPDRVRCQQRANVCYQEMWEFAAGGRELSHFGLRQFRYAELIGYRGELTADKARLIAVRAPFDESAASMASSDDRLNQVWALCRNSVRATAMDLYTDCFNRERIAYEADGFITMLADFAVASGGPACRRFLDYIVGHPTWPCEWLQMTVPLFHEYYWETGDKEMVERHFDALLEKASFRRLLADGLVRKFPLEAVIDYPPEYRDGYDMGDREYLTVPNALLARNLRDLSFLAGEIGRRELAAELAAEARRSTLAARRAFFDPSTGLYVDRLGSSHCSLHANVWAAWCGLAGEEELPPIMDFLERKGMACSVYTAFFYLDVLFSHGRPQTAYSHLVSDAPRSWISMIRRGATITTEKWPTDPDAPMTLAHPWGAAPAALIARHVFGVRPATPGYATYEIAPKKTPLASGRYETAKPAAGKIVSEIHAGRGAESC